MLKKLGCAARKLILITTLMALVATVTSCGSDDKSATESRTRNFSASLDCGEPTVAPEPVAQTPMAETVEEAEQAAAAAFAAMREAEEAARYLEEERRYAQQEATAAYAEWEKNGRTEADWDVAAAADARTSVVNDNLDLALSNMGQVSMFHTLLVNHTMQIGGETGRNSSADAERNACLAEERQLYADWEAQQAALELEQQKNDLRLINEQINALDESGVTRADQIVLTENRVAAEREAAAAADKLKNFSVVEDAANKFAEDLAAFRVAQNGRNDSSLTEEQRQGHKNNYRALYLAKGESSAALIPLANELAGLNLADNVHVVGEGTLDKLNSILEEVEGAAVSSADAAEAAEAEELAKYWERRGKEKAINELSEKAEQIKEQADAAQQALYERSQAADRAQQDVIDTQTALANAIEQGT